MAERVGDCGAAYAGSQLYVNEAQSNSTAPCGRGSRDFKEPPSGGGVRFRLTASGSTRTGLGACRPRSPRCRPQNLLAPRRPALGAELRSGPSPWVRCLAGDVVQALRLGDRSSGPGSGSRRSRQLNSGAVAGGDVEYLLDLDEAGQFAATEPEHARASVRLRVRVPASTQPPPAELNLDVSALALK